MTRQAYPRSGPRFPSLAVLSAFGLLACASPSTSDNNTGGTTGGGTGGNHATGGATGGGTGGNHATGGTTGGGTGGTTVSTGGTTGGGTGGNHATGGTTGGGTGGTTGGSTGGTTGGGTGGTTHTGGTTGSTGGTTGSTGGTTGSTGGTTGTNGCSNTNTSLINEDASGYICGNQWGIQGAWYCYTSDTSNACNKTGAIPWNASSGGMCLKGSIASGGTALLGFKVNSGPPGGSATPGSWDASKIVGFAITLASGSSGAGSGGSVVYIEYPTTKDVLSNGDAPGVTVPGVAGTSVTYNALFSDSVLANSTSQNSVDPTQLTDVKIAIPPDTNSRNYDLCITKVVPITTAPSIPTGTYGPAWNNELAQAVNGVNGYAVQTAPFSMSGLALKSMQVTGGTTSGDVGFTYQANAGPSGNSPSAFPAVISGWGPGEAGVQFYGPYKGGQTIGGTNKLTSVVSNWSFTMGGTGDAVFDVWFGNSANPAKPQTELMVWIGNTGKNPLSDTGTTAAGPAVMGRTPFVAANNGTGQQVVSYWVASSGSANSVSSFNLLPYFQDAASHSYAGLSNNSYLLGVQTGFEVYDTASWTTTDYNISIK